MPNHIQNIITADPIVIKHILNAEHHVDFNTVIPMPETLKNIIHEGGVEQIIDIVFGVKPDKNELLGHLQMGNRMRSVQECRKLIDTESDASWDNMMVALNNMRQYGHWSWYSWAIANWGTKWNAYSTVSKNDSQVAFQTAWSPPYGFYKELSKKFPDAAISVETSDEDSGSKCFKIEYKNGEEIFREELRDGPAMQHYFKLWHGEENPSAEFLKEHGYNERFEYVGEDA